MSEDVEYCYENDGLDEAIKQMEKKQIHRLIVPNDRKTMSGILSLSYIARRSQDNDFCAQAVEGILEDKKMDLLVDKDAPSTWATGCFLKFNCIIY